MSVRPPLPAPHSLRLAALRQWFCAALLCLATAAAAAGGAPRVEVTVADADWGEARVEEIRAVLEAVAGELAQLFPSNAPLRLHVAPSASTPMVLFRLNASGAHQVLLRARDRIWADYVYEFAHELGHIYTNYGRHAREPGLARYQWFEEAVCDMVALYTLRRLSGQSGADALPLLASQRDAMRELADQLMRAPHRSALHGADLAAWLRANEPALRANPYLRQRNEQVAAQLLKIFEREPARLVALAFLNASSAPAPADFGGYLADWCEHTPAAAQPVVREIMAAFGFPPP